MNIPDYSASTSAQVRRFTDEEPSTEHKATDN